MAAGRGVQEFFEGIDTLLKTRREDEVAFNLTFNKASLKKVIREYSSKDVGPAMVKTRQGRACGPPSC